MLAGWLIWSEVLLPRWLRKEALRLRKTNDQCALSNGVTNLHFSSRLSLFCEYLIILAQLAKIDQATSYLKTEKPVTQLTQHTS